MKKAIVLLLALAVLGGAVFAQVTTTVALSGSVTVIDQDMSGVFTDNGTGYDVLTIKASKDGKYGFSLSDQNILSDGLNTIRDWNVWYKVANDKVRVSFGNLRNGDIRMTLPAWNTTLFGATDRITGYGVLTNLYLMDGLTIGVNLPFGTTAADTVDVLQMMDLGAKYVIADVGTLVFLANLDLVASSNIVNFGFTYSGVENLVATAIYKGTLATASTHRFAVGADYTMDKLNAGAEFCGVYTTDLAWDLDAYASYTITDAISAGFLFLFDSASAYDAGVWGMYDFGNGFDAKLNVGYAGDLYYNVKLEYSIAF